MNDPTLPLPPPTRRVYCNRTLNLRSIRAIGYDMDYTLVHYHVEAWEQCAYEHLKTQLAARGWPVDGMAFDSALFIRGLVIDRELGNLVKANRFGYVKRASHGTRMLDFDEQRKTYGRTIVDLAEPRWVFLNTLFSQSEACMYAQFVDRLDRGDLPEILGYSDLYARVKQGLDRAHLEGALKAEILTDPQRFVALDPDVPATLLDQKDAGKRLLLITNSDWSYTRDMLAYAFDRFLPTGMGWRDLFDLVIVSAGKPQFFEGRQAAYRLASEDGLLRPNPGPLETGAVYVGGDARKVEDSLGLSDEEILYVGDHLFMDVHVTKSALRWRTALILRELEAEIEADEGFAPHAGDLSEHMLQKERLESQLAAARLVLQRARKGRADIPEAVATRVEAKLADLRERLARLDDVIAPLAQASNEVLSSRWGSLMRAGNDRSHLAKQVEQYADLYTSRVSNLLHVTPFAYLRAPRGNLPHDR